MSNKKSNDASSSSAYDHHHQLALDPLKVSVVGPDGAEHDLQFQWMRIHPCIAIAASTPDNEESTTTPAAIQVSRMFKHYQRAAALTNKQEKDPVPVSPFLRASGVHVDLCDLFDPPLLSEEYLKSTAVVESGSTEEEDDDDRVTVALNGKQTRFEGSKVEATPLDLRAWFFQILDRACSMLLTREDYHDANAVLEGAMPNPSERSQISAA
jgi:hypothetical protein